MLLSSNHKSSKISNPMTSLGLLHSFRIIGNSYIQIQIIQGKLITTSDHLLEENHFASELAMYHFSQNVYWILESLTVHFSCSLLEAFNLNVNIWNKNNWNVTCKRGLLYYEIKVLRPNVLRKIFGGSCVRILYLHYKSLIVVNYLCFSHHPGWLNQWSSAWLHMRRTRDIFKCLFPRLLTKQRPGKQYS